MIPTRSRISFRRPNALTTIAAGAVVAVAGCGSSSPQAAGPTGTPLAASAQPSPNAPAGDPCSVIPIPTLEQITGLTGLTVQKQLGKSTNGCHWGTSAGTSSVAYDMLPMVGTADEMIARIQEAASGSGGHISFKKVDLGHGHDGVQGVVQGSSAPMTTGSVDLFLPPDRYAAIALILPANSDAGTITLNVGKPSARCPASCPPRPSDDRL